MKGVLLLLLSALAVGCPMDVQPTPEEHGAHLLSTAACGETVGPTCAGEAAPAITLEDIQPASQEFGTSYGLEAFTGRVTLVVLLAAW